MKGPKSSHISVLNFVTSGGVFSVLKSVEMCDQFLAWRAQCTSPPEFFRPTLMYPGTQPTLRFFRGLRFSRRAPHFRTALIHSLSFRYDKELAKNYHISKAQRMNRSRSKMTSFRKLRKATKVKTIFKKSETWAVPLRGVI